MSLSRKSFVALMLSASMVMALAPPAIAAQGGSAGLREFVAADPAPRGEAAIDVLGMQLTEVAQAYGMSAVDLRDLFRSDRTLSVDRAGKLFHVDVAIDPVTAAGPAPETLTAPPTTDPVFFQHSRPGADHVIYLDFDGHTTTGTAWNSNYGIGTIVSPAYDTNGNTNAWSALELSVIDNTWRTVAEDFAPFDVDVTTEAPPVDRLIKSGGGDTQWGVRVVITDDTWANCGCGGHAYIDSFNWSTDTPVFVYNSSLAGVSEASTHEVGHAVGLSHDGTSSVTYYQGHGTGEASWAPLMGASYYESVTQWSKGEYYQANNNGSGANYGKGPDDLAVIAAYNGFGYRVDDHGDTIAAATALSGTSVFATGVIERTTDVDVFEFSTAGGPVNFAFAPAGVGANLNIKATLSDAAGSPITVANPTSSLSASINVTVAAGTYYLEVDGTGTGNPFSSSPTGYTEYGSIGQYSITGTVPPSTSVAFIGDYGDGSSAEGDVAALVNGWSPDAVVTAGDNRYGSSSYDQVVGQFYCDFLTGVPSGTNCAGGNSPTNRFFPSPGNHEYTDGGGLAEYLAYFDLPGASVATSGTSGNERYYDFVVGPVHFFAIDSQGALTSGSDMTAQQNWLQAQLAASTAQWQVVVMHHPPYSSGQHGSSTAMRWPYAAWGADAVVAGHDHTYERIETDGITYFVNGLGGRSIYSFGSVVSGSQVRYNSDYGAMRLDADAGELTFQFVNRQSSVIDTHTITATPPPGGVVDVAISNGDDDVEERTSDGVLDFTSTDLELGVDNGYNEEQTIGMLFRGVSVPQGATITAAYLEFTVDETNSGTTNVVIRAEDSDNAPSFAAVVNNVTNRATTAASTSWSIPAWNTIGVLQQSPDLSAVVQEVTDRTGWSSGNNVVFVIDGTGERTAESYNGVPSSAPRLHIEYTTGPPPPNVAPVAGFSSVVTDLSVAFADTSSDSDGTVVTWSWVFGDGETSSLQHPSHGYGLAGTYAVSLTVTDDDGATDTATGSVTVTVPPPNVPPSAGFSSVVTDLSVAFADTSSDSDGLVVAWLWSFGDGGTSSLQDPSYTYGSAGTYTVSLTVTDDDGASDTASGSVTVTVPPPNVPPSAGFSSVVTDLSVAFADTSSDSDGLVVAWLWSFGDGGTSSLQDPSYTYGSAGTYTVSLTVTDDDGASDTASGSVTVTDPPEPSGVYMSFRSSTTVGGVSVDDEDIVLWDGAGGYSVVFDGSDVGLGGMEIDGFDVIGSSAVLLSFTGNVSLPGAGSVDDSDIVLFTGSLGASTSGSFAMYFDGSDVGLSKGSEDVDGLALLDDGSLLITTVGGFSVPGVSGKDEDVLRFAGSFGGSTSGSWSMYFDADDIGVDKDVDGLAAVGSELLFSADSSFNEAGVSADEEDIVTFTGTYGPATSGTLSMFFDGSSNGVGEDIGGIDLALGPPPPNVDPVAGFSSVVTDLSVAFTDTSSDSDGLVEAWLWSFGDGSSSSLQHPSHGYGSAGTYSVSLTVTDDDGATDTASGSVTVTVPPPNVDPVAGFSSVVTDLSVAFTDTSSDSDGSVVAWAWSFGDEASSSEQHPTHGYVSAGTYAVSLTVTDDDGATDTATGSVTVTEPPEPTGVYMSFKASTSLGGVAVEDEDIVLWDGAGGYSVVFDGSDVGLSGFEIDGFDVIGSGQVLLSFTGAGSASGLSFDDSDVVLFTGTLGSATSGSFSMYFDGSDVGLSKGSEDVDGVALLSDGSLLLSTGGDFKVSGLSGKDDDVIRFTGTFGSSTSGGYTMHFDGSDVGMDKDVDAIADDGVSMYFSATDSFSAGGVSAQDEDVVTFTGTFGPSTSGSYTLFWDGSANGTTQDLGGLDLA